MLSDIGIKSEIRPRKVPRTEANKRNRVAWCREQLRLRPTPESWETVGFSDETWAMNDPQWKQRVLVDTEAGEKASDFPLKRRKPEGWMFWGIFAGRRKGPYFIWEKEYGGIDAINYVTFVVPLIKRFYDEIGGFVFQQDNAPSHRARITKAALQEGGIELLRWPAYSPDLSPIENVWSWMKNWMEINCPEGKEIQDLDPWELRMLAYRAWLAVPEDLLLLLAHSMPRRLQMCIEANGDSINF
jgi:transposase